MTEAILEQASESLQFLTLNELFLVNKASASQENQKSSRGWIPSNKLAIRQSIPRSAN